MASQFLELRTGQNLTMTPALQQSLKVLQLSALDLEEEIVKALDDNPMLERIEAIAITATISSTASPRQDDDSSDRPESAQPITLRDHLLEQLGVIRNLPDSEVMLVKVLIENLDESGWLSQEFDEIVEMVSPYVEEPNESLRRALDRLQTFDPCGVGARNLSECLDLQLTYWLPEHCPEWVGTPELTLAHQLCRHHLSVLATGNTVRLASLLHTDEAMISRIHALLLKLNPRPASYWTTPEADYAIPDVIVRKVNTKWVPMLNEAVMPKLRINTEYAHVLTESKRGLHSELMQKMQHAKGFIKSVGQRFDTILRVSKVVVTHQQLFFEQGWGAVRPLTLREVAAELGMHESTISRATTQKFILTPMGTIELKKFFSTSMNTDDGQNISSTAIQSRIGQLIEQENTLKPLSDAQLTVLLEKEGIHVARRTIAKYRESLRIPVAALRKSQSGAQKGKHKDRDVK
jgi:RNA polymerase sigma-54 factor